MRPASRTNLSFHSSSDYSVRPMYVDESMSVLSSDVAKAGDANSTASPYNSDAFHTARSAGVPSPLPTSRPPLVSPLDTRDLQRSTLQRQAPDPPLSRQVSSAVGAKETDGGGGDERRRSSAGSASPPPRRMTSAGLSEVPLPQAEEYPTELPRPHPPSALPKRAKAAHGTAQSAGPSLASSLASPHVPNQQRSGGSGSGGGGWWSSVMRAMGKGRGKMNHYLDTLVDPDANTSVHINADGDGNSAAAGGGTTPTPNSAGTALSGFDGLFDDVGHSPYHDNEAGDPYGVGDGVEDDGVRAERVYVPYTGEPFGPLPPMARPIPEATEEEQLLDEATDVDAEPPTIEVDLVSALHGYCANPNEAYGHLVAAALTSRSRERPVTGAEIAEAQHNPFLVRMIVASGCLDYDDPVAQQNVQDTMDQLMPEDNTDFTPALFEYLETFFKMPFIRLSHWRYVMLKSSGFENITLMHENPHVLPQEKLHSVVVNYGSTMSLVSLVFVVVGLLSTTTCTVAIAVALASWMMLDDSDYQSYGFYTLIAYGCGYALHLIFMVFFMRTKEDEKLYEDTNGMDVPSPYVNVFPALPIFEVFCVVRYVRSRSSRALAYKHNVLVSSRLAGVCYAFCFGFPQYVVQSYFNYTSRVILPRHQRAWSFYFLMVAALVQWGVALFRFCYMMIAYDSTSGLGFACFNIRRPRSFLERHSGVPRIMYYLFVFLLEVGVYIVVASSIEFGNIEDCIFLPTCVISISGVLMVLILIIYTIVVFQPGILVRLSFVGVPICALVVATTVLGSAPFSTACTDFDRVVFKSSFIFGYIAYGAFFACFLVWMVQMVFTVILKACYLKFFPRLTGPLARSVKKKSSQDSDATGEEPEASEEGHGAEDADGAARSEGR